jgi:hypothetical protein
MGPLLLAGGVMAFVWWPNGDYKPIQPHERGTIQGGFAALRQIATGRPALTTQRERELHGAPTEASRLRRAKSAKPTPQTGQERRSAPDERTTPEPTQGPQGAEPALPQDQGEPQTVPEGQTTTSEAPGTSPGDQTTTSAAPTTSATTAPAPPPPAPPGASP